MNTKKVFLYDTTLRDGSQRRGLSLTLEDKLRITKLLDDFGIPYIEGGWPGANPKDSEYFCRMKDIELANSTLVAFGSTRKVNGGVDDDSVLKALLEAQTPAVALVGKSSTLHVTEVLRTSLEENLSMIRQSIEHMKQHGKEVIFDAEHFFDGYCMDPAYAVETLWAASEAGADWLALCDTNGGSLPSFISEVVTTVRSSISTPLGIHTHNDCELAVANVLVAVDAGCTQIQGTVNGYGERCGNANLISLIPTLQLKKGIDCVADEKIKSLTKLSRSISEIANLDPDTQAPYVGVAAFAHKGGIHAAAVEKATATYEHIEPEVVGNRRQALLSELSGRGNVRMRASELGVDVKGNESSLVQQIKELEGRGYEFENAEGSIELFIRRTYEGYKKPFDVIDTMVVSERRSAGVLTVEAIVKLRVAGEIVHTAAEGDGPVNALDRALRKALIPHFPDIKRVRLADYKVRILDPQRATSATTRVLIEAADNGQRWSTVGCNENIIEASFQALTDSLELFLLRNAEAAKKVSKTANG